MQLTGKLLWRAIFRTGPHVVLAGNLVPAGTVLVIPGLGSRTCLDSVVQGVGGFETVIIDLNMNGVLLLDSCSNHSFFHNLHNIQAYAYS